MNRWMLAVLGLALLPAVRAESLPPLREVATVALGGEFTCALDVRGLASCWGSNEVGQLGVAEGVLSARTTPRAGAGCRTGIGSTRCRRLPRLRGEGRRPRDLLGPRSLRRAGRRAGVRRPGGGGGAGGTERHADQRRRRAHLRGAGQRRRVLLGQQRIRPARPQQPGAGRHAFRRAGFRRPRPCWWKPATPTPAPSSAPTTACAAGATTAKASSATAPPPIACCR